VTEAQGQLGKPEEKERLSLEAVTGGLVKIVFTDNSV
jgi:hypothetical protein